MVWLGTVFVALATGAAVVAAVNAALTARRRRLWAARTFLALNVGCLLWVLALLGGIFAGDEGRATFWIYRVRFTPISLLPVLLLMFALDFTGRQEWLRPRRLAWLLVVPLATQVLNYSPALRPLFIRGEHLLRLGPLYLPMDAEGGPWFRVHAAYSYLLSAVAIVVLAHYGLRLPARYRPRVGVLLGGIVAAVAGSLITNLGPLPRLDWTVVGFGAACGLWSTLLLREYGLLDVVPLARDEVITRLRDPVFVLDESRGVVDANPSAAALCGRPGRELMGVRLEEACPELAAWLDAAVGSGKDSDLRVGGRIFEPALTHLTEPSGRAVGLLLTLHDVTERQQLIDDLDAYARTVAHDLKDPVTAMIGYCGLARVTPDVALSLHDLCATVERQCQAMLEIIDALLALARVRQAGEVELGAVDMRQAVETALARVEGARSSRGAEIHLPESWPRAVGYAPWLVEVWVNLLGNAIKYGGTPPRIVVGAEVDGRGQVRFWVEDNGPGIPPAERQRAFAELVRIKPSRGDGYGIGLALAWRILRRLGGEIGVESGSMGGARFWFTLPAASG